MKVNIIYDVNVRKELKMKSTQTKSGFAVARVVAITFITFLAVVSFLIFGLFQGQSKILVDMYLAYLKNLDQATAVFTALKTVCFLF